MLIWPLRVHLISCRPSHRDLRDDHACSLKYGKDWEKYKSIVKYKLIPFVY